MSVSEVLSLKRYVPKCGFCGGKVTWVRLKLRPNTAYYLCDSCYGKRYPTGQQGAYVAWPRRTDDD